MTDQSLAKALEDVKRAEFKRRRVAAVSLRHHPNGKTDPSRYQTATIAGEER